MPGVVEGIASDVLATDSSDSDLAQTRTLQQA
jgi:hypothetical protein